MKELEKDSIRQTVRDNYKKVALNVLEKDCCGTTDCCSSTDNTLSNYTNKLGYSNEELQSVPEGSNMGLGCGNPQAIANIKPEETVLDLGSGGGFDCFLAARKVGESGRVIGVDMTPEMISKARLNAEKNSFKNVEFRLGEIENLPVANDSVDVIISNCVINLSPDKNRVFQEAYRVLKKGGRLAISDIVLTADLPDDIRNDLSFYSGCISGSSYIKDLEQYLQLAGFNAIRIVPKDDSHEFIKEWAPGRNVQDYIVSAVIEAVK
ncbi:arsenite methyltransferase [Gottfriedia acidiceleris]|uniref:Arsenite methyltransferase n=1 Tax=Gottfriedia acidiceleris TaxID=371036 RepID=A0ABY4JRV4_9BACI|nr:arsenite methyltransferase [Gottfriedia acidiceleris]UPM56151.1 arsenite methyltransferase [Gottfriedia acidiceleris]